MKDLTPTDKDPGTPELAKLVWPKTMIDAKKILASVRDGKQNDAPPNGAPGLKTTRSKKRGNSET